MRAPDPGKVLLRELLTLAGDKAALVEHKERPWASLTFSGSRHETRLLFAGHAGVVAAEAFCSALPEHEFAIPGHLLADATTRKRDYRHLNAERPEVELTVDTLLLEEA
jgi:hypothetical protein